jgi:hypothetical protein
LLRVTGLLLFLLAGLSVAPPVSAQTTNKQAKIDALNSEMNDAMEQVRKIVNQPVTRYVRQSGMDVAVFQPGWFHPGANTPDFNNVDVRTTQEKIYDKFGYVSSDLNPGVMFLGRELEFNSNTKYFYTDRSLPKKKLTEPEMLEINRLYRIIGHCQQQLAQFQNPEPAPETTSESTAETIETRFPMLKSTAVRVTLVVLALLGIVYLFRKRSE